MIRHFILIILVLTVSGKVVNAQFTDRYWAFGDSAAIDFRNSNNPVFDTSVMRARGSCASICDSLGQLLIYSASPNYNLIQIPGMYSHGYVLNKANLIISNGDSLRSSGWYQEMTIVPDPGNAQRFYVFTMGVTPSAIPGFYYSVVDLSMNNGLGYVVQKNIRLETFPVCDGMASVKHGNGRDWWVVIKNWDNTIALDEFYVYLISPSGVTKMPVQHIGTAFLSNIFTIKFNILGTKLYATQWASLVERYDFDRCSGLLSNALTINPRDTNNNPPNRFYWSHAVSPDESKLYVTSIYNGTNADTSYLVQYDLTAPNFLASADTLYTFNRNSAGGGGPVAGLLQLGPDGKIYLSTNYETQDCGFQWLYCDTSSFFTENMNLSIINHPDSLGAACDFQPYSFYLGGHRSYVGLPNNPNYELGLLVGSACDTLGNVGINEVFGGNQHLFVYYDTEWQKAFINAKGLTGKKYILTVYDITGKAILTQKGSLTNEFYTYSMPMESFASGVYIISLETEKEKLTNKIIKK
jgi:Secretion system C-terminal sorting domain